MEELVYQLQQQNTKEKAFKILMQQYQKPLYAHIYRYVCNHEDTNDILQNAFIKIWKSIDSFRNDCALYSWLYRIAGNEAITFINKKNKKLTVNIDQTTAANAAVLDSENSGEIEQKFQLALYQLPAKQKQVFIMRYYDEMPYEKMSEILETSIGALKSSYHHAVKKMEEFLLQH
jgi:RNA polymerase sigma-70 factor (ECF subfamily)